MNKNLVLIAVLAVAGFLVYRHMQQQQQLQLAAQGAVANNPVGGTQQATATDVFGQALALANSIFGAVTQSQAQTSAKPM